MDWPTFSMAWGPAIPILLVLVKILYDVVYKIVPRGFKSILKMLARIEAKSHKRHKQGLAKAEERHLEHLAAMAKMEAACEHKKTDLPRRPTK